MDGRTPRDVIEYQLLADQEQLELEVRRGGLELQLDVVRDGSEPLGIEVDAPLFDRVRTCDNHCEFCFIHQLPKGLRKSLYVRDDDYRLSFLYGNFTTLTRFTEADLERVVSEGLSPLWVSIHSTDPELRSRLLRNRRGATSLRWLRALLDHGVVVHGQVVVCPGVNDGPALADTLCGVLDLYPELASVACVPLGVSRFNQESSMRPHTRAEAQAVLDEVHSWQDDFLRALGRRVVFASDEYYLLAGRKLPPLRNYGDAAQVENGVGTTRVFEAGFLGRRGLPSLGPGGFFQSVDGAPAAGYRAERVTPSGRPGMAAADRAASNGVTILTGDYGAAILRPLVGGVCPEVEVVAVENRFFGGNIKVAGLLTGSDLVHALRDAAPNRRYLIPDVCLSGGRFLDGMAPSDLPVPVEVVRADGPSLRSALEAGAAA
jgi:NifB/MoaA-like Fe-S oxidoreductase